MRALWACVLGALCAASAAHAQKLNAGSADLSAARAALAHHDPAAAAQLFRKAQGVAGGGMLSAEDEREFAIALAGTSRVPEAQAELARALTHYPHDAALNDTQGTLYAQGGDLAQAMPFFEAAAAADSRNGRAQYHLGAALLAMGQTDAALGALSLAASLLPDDFIVQLDYGRALSAARRDKDALTALHRALALKPAQANPQALYALGLALQASGDAQGALPLLDAAAQAPRADNAALINDALAHMQTGDAAGSLQLYERALAIGPDAPLLRENYGAAYLQQADLADAIVQFRKGLELEPLNPMLHYDLGLAYKLKDDLPAAIDEFERTTQLDPSLPDPFYSLGITLMQQGKFADAAAQFKSVVQLDPKNGDAWAMLGSNLRDAGSSAAAVEALQHAIALEPEQPSLHIQLAALEAQSGDKAAAAKERAIAADLSRAANARQRAGFALKSGRALLEQGKIEDAILQLRNAVTAEPNDAEAHALLANAYTRQGKLGEAAGERRQADALRSTAVH